VYEFLQRTIPDAAQDFGVGGRIAWALYCRDVGGVTMEEGDLSTAITTLREAVFAFPFPKSLELLGECLLRQGKPVEAVIFLAAAVGMNDVPQFRQLSLLGKALAAARDNHISKIMLRKAISIEPDTEALELLREVISRSTHDSPQ
jgi:tetratricopeptide (TPR) repeat protein